MHACATVCALMAQVFTSPLTHACPTSLGWSQLGVLGPFKNQGQARDEG